MEYYGSLGHLEKARSMERDVYSERLKLHGDQHKETLRAASNYASFLKNLSHFGEAKSLLRKVMPVARRVLGDNDGLTLKMRWIYAQSLYWNAGASLDDVREAVTTLEDAERIARRVLGGSHPTTAGIEAALRDARAALHATLEQEK